jgi:hypothetical protein
LQSFWRAAVSLEGKTEEDYQKAIRKFCDDNPELTIYLAGEVSHPGISDLDFVVVERTPIVSPEVEEFLMGGNIIVMPRSCMSRIPMIENFNLNLVQGERTDFEKNNNDHFSIVEIIEWLPERILLLESLDIESYTPQEILLYLKSADRSIKNVEKLTGKEFDRVSTDKLRSNYKVINLQQVLKGYIKACESAWKEFSSFCSVCEPSIVGNAKISSYYQFDHKRFPLLLSYLNFLSTGEGSLPQKLRERMAVENFECKFDQDFLQFIRKRFSLIGEVYDFHVAKGSKSGMIKYGWFL